MKKGLAVLLCLCIAFVPAIANAGAGINKPPGYYKSLLPPLPKPKLPDAAATQLKVDLTVAPKKTQAASAHATSSLPAVSPDELPQGWTIIGGIKNITTVPDKMVITQDASEAIINWRSFNIGSKAEVDFSQKSSSWICLNRIFDLNPSQIFGKIQALGEVFLINQNGILFQPGSQVDLHTLIASSLDINVVDRDFLNGKFTLPNGQPGLDFELKSGNPDAVVENQGDIYTDTVGSVFLLAPYVENNGTITAQTGQIGLAAGKVIDIYQNVSVRDWKIVDVVEQSSGDAVDRNNGHAVNNGLITTEAGGLIGMYGTGVDQNGVIRAQTSLQTDGEIELMASEEVSTGPQSKTCTFISASTDTEYEQSAYKPGSIGIFGLDPSNLNGPTTATAPKEIVLNGLIQAPSGSIDIVAQNSVTLESLCSVDVSGVWLDKPASANTTQVQLNSVELRDYPDQKNGILYGATITVDNHLGSSIGDISGYLTTKDETAQERSLSGGSILISTLDTGKVIVNQGASIDFSGGGTRYSGRYITTTGLISNGQIHDISSAPEALQYTGITSINKYVGSYVEGADAGTLSLLAGKIVLDGNIHGAATAGIYQTRTSELLNTIGDQNSLGVQMPAGGTLFIGAQPTNSVQSQDAVVNSVVLYGPNDQLPSSSNSTYLSAQKLSAAGLTDLQIAANTSIAVTSDAAIVLNPGIAKLAENSYTKATLSLAARWIDVWGKINVPSGYINLTAEDNVTSYPSNLSSYQMMNSEGISLEKGSQIIAAGQRIDDSVAANGVGGTTPFTYIAGGTVSIDDLTYDSSYFHGSNNYTNGVTIAAGSLIDVSGGYGISRKGVVTGGDAGSLSVAGERIALNPGSILKGYSIEGNNGGSITLHAQSITIATSSQANEDNSLVLGQDQFDDTGFEKIYLQSVNDITVGPETRFSPSIVKFSVPIPGVSGDEDSLVSVPQDLMGKSSISLTAGSLLWSVDPYGEQIIPSTTATIKVLTRAEVSVGPTGSISLKAPDIAVYGTLNAPAGTVTLTAGTASTPGTLTLEEGAKIEASGYNEPSQSPVMQGFPLGCSPLSGGAVTLSSTGSVSTADNSEIDVSGSPTATTWVLDKGGVPIAQAVASNAGSVTISGNTLSLQGELMAAHQPNLQGGTLSITSLDTRNSYVINGADFKNYLVDGFDAISFQSYYALAFQGFSGTKDSSDTVARRLTLDAPSFTGSGVTYLWAPQIQLRNTYNSSPGSPTPSTTGSLTLQGGWIDLYGAFSLSGFKNVTLSAEHDFTLSGSQGQMIMTSTGLTLQAARIYPSMFEPSYSSSFTIEDSGGNVTIEGTGSHDQSPIYSAGGSISIDAQNIEMRNGAYLAAPMGKISLVADQTSGTVTLDDGSTISTKGWTSIPVNYGPYTTSGSQSAPEGSISITGDEVITKRGSTIDVSGGGSIFTYEFQESTDGTVDPLLFVGTNNVGQTLWQNRYVIVPGSDYSLTPSAASQAGLQVGQAVYLEGVRGLKAGVYTLLPEQYAFLPGAMVVTDTGTKVASGTQLETADGFPVAAGYFTCRGTSIRPSLMDAFEVQPATYLLTQGDFSPQASVAGNAGSVTITANTTIVDGTIFAKPLNGNTSVVVDGTSSTKAPNGYQGGTISLSGTNAFIEESSSQTPANPATGTLYVAADALTGFYEIEIGNLNSSAGAITQTVTMEHGSVLSATKVVLSAQNTITLDSGAQIVTVDSSGKGNGSASLITPTGLLTMQQNSLVHASDQVNMTIGQLNYQAGSQGLQIDHGALDLTGQNVYFIPQQGSSPSSPDPLGLYLTNAFWSNFRNFDDVTISASGGYTDGSVQGLVGFLGGMTLSAKHSFTVNAAAIKGFLNSAAGAVTIDAPTISLLDRGGPSPPSPSLSNLGTLTLNAGQIYIGEGAFLNGLTPGNPNLQNGLLLDGFSSLNFNAAKDVVFQGTGSLVTGADNLNFSSARLTTSYYEDFNPDGTIRTPYTAASFTVSAANAAVNIAPPDKGVATPGVAVTPGGALEIDGNSIDVSGVIQMASGTLKLNGTTGVKLENNAQVLDGGTSQAIVVNGHITEVGSPAGSVYLNSQNGSVDIMTGALVDVSGVSEENAYYAGKYGIKYNVFADPNDLGVNAGLISIYSHGSADLQGTLKGAAGTWTSYDNKSSVKGIGGSFILNALDLSSNSRPDKGFSALNTNLFNGGFTENIDLTLTGVDTPNQVLTIGDKIVARNFSLTADNWSIDFTGEVDSTAVGGGGTIQFNSGGSLTLAAGSEILSPGATVFLNTADGKLDQPGILNFYGSIDVAGQSGQAEGTVHFRSSMRSGLNAVNMNLAGAINGANQVLAEGVLYGDDSGIQAQPYTYVTDKTITSADIWNWKSGLQVFMNGQGKSIEKGLFTHLKLEDSNHAEFVPGLEVRSEGNITLQDAWDFTTGGNYSWDKAIGIGFLTLRAGGNLNIYANLVDHPSSIYSPLLSDTGKESWGFNLVAGADLSSADVMSTGRNDAYWLYIGEPVAGNPARTLSPAMVYTEGGSIQFASAGDTWIGFLPSPGTSYMINSHLVYDLGTYSGRIQGQVGGSLDIEGGAVQTAVGDIDIRTAGDLNLEFVRAYLGTIRTTGEGTGTDYWSYGHGGNITLNVGGSVNGGVTPTSGNIDYGWDSYNNGSGWSANYYYGSTGVQTSFPTEGLATMAGGNLTVFAGGSFNCQAGTFAGISIGGTMATDSGGNLTIFSGGDMQGRFLVGGVGHFGELRAMGNFNSGDTTLPVEMFADKVSVAAQGDVDLGSIVNPTISRLSSTPISTSQYPDIWDLEYGHATASGGVYASVSLTSVIGDVTLHGYEANNLSMYDTYDDSLSILPPTVSIVAGGNINLLHTFTLAPYSKGNLTLLAGGNIDGVIDGSTSIFMSEASDALSGPYEVVYGPQPNLPQEYTGGGGVSGTTGYDAAGLLHVADAVPVVVSAGSNIEYLKFYIPKEADITAGGNIDIYYYGHNNSYTPNKGATYSSNEVTVIKAAGSIGFGSWQSADGGDSGILVGGPGTVVLEAGRSIDLGTSAAIEIQANSADPSQPTTASALIIASGYSGNFYNLKNGSTKTDSDFFKSLGQLGTEYSMDLAAGDTAEAQQVVADINTSIIAPFDRVAVPVASGTGDIDMTFSKIAAVSYTPGMFIFAHGSLNVGQTTLGSAGQGTDTGIYTGYGGGINIFANKDVNVNESRVMTCLGGDITVWSTSGNINAGKGAKTAVTTSAPTWNCVGGTDSQGNCLGYYVEIFSPPTVGSGIRAVTYSPGLGESMPLAGNIYMFAPEGDINAGEAGIAGRNVILGAVQVLNAQNIVFSAGSVGVPVASQGISGLSALSGVGSVTQAMQVQEAAIASAAGTKLAQAVSAASEAFAAASLEVRVLSIFDADPSDGSWERTDN